MARHEERMTAPFVMTEDERRQAHLFGSKENVILYKYGPQALEAHFMSERRFWAWVERRKAKR